MRPRPEIRMDPDPWIHDSAVMQVRHPNKPEKKAAAPAGMLPPEGQLCLRRNQCVHLDGSGKEPGHLQKVLHGLQWRLYCQ